MSKEIKQIVDKYRYDQGLRIYSNRHYFHDDSIYRSIKNNNDVEGAYNYVKNSIEMYSKTYPLCSEDIIELEKAVAKYEIAVSKVLTFCAGISNNQFNYTADGLQELIDNIYMFYDKISDIHMRKMCQD